MEGHARRTNFHASRAIPMDHQRRHARAHCDELRGNRLRLRRQGLPAVKADVGGQVVPGLRRRGDGLCEVLPERLGLRLG